MRSAGYAIRVLFARAVHQAYPGQIFVTVMETGGIIENMSRLKLRLMHLGEANPVKVYNAYYGLADYKEQKNPNITGIGEKKGKKTDREGQGAFPGLLPSTGYLSPVKNPHNR